MKELKILIDPDNIEQMLVGIQLLCCGIQSASFELSLTGVLHENKELSEYQNAYNYLCFNYTKFQGAFNTIEAIISMLNDAIANGDLQIAEGNHNQPG